MVMQTRYEMQLEAEASSVHGDQMSDMEREVYQKRINDLLDGLESLLNANVKMGERIEKLEEKVKDYDDLKDKYEKLKGELAMRKRDKYGKGGEKPKDDTSSSNNDKTKDEDEEDYINNGSKNDVPPVEDSEEEESVSSEPPAKKERDLSNRPDHYKKMHADVQVVHECDLDKLEELGLEFLHYTRPVDQFDRISITRQDTYRFVWVRDKKTGKEFSFFYPKEEKREVIEKFLGDFQGTLMTDAYNAYAYFSQLDGCSHACCWAHVRRIYWSALKDYKDSLAQEFIELIGVLYKVELESILLHRTEAEVLEARKTESIPILNELDQKSALLLAKVKSKELKISSKLEHALNYMRNHWKELIAYIDIGNVLIDNNCCERAVRPFTNLRKSFGGFSSELGGAVAAAWLTFVESCKLQKKAALDVFRGYFQRIAEGRRDYDLITEEVLC